MAQRAPEYPTTEQLEATHQLTTPAVVDITLGRERSGSILAGEVDGFVGVVGGCAMTRHVDISLAEGQRVRKTTEEVEGLVVIQRECDWKPRTNPEDWHGLITGDPDGELEPEQTAEIAYNRIITQANNGVAMSMELGYYKHAVRNSKALALGWIGGRAIKNREMMERIALFDESLPLAIKNGLDGTVNEALEHVAHLNRLREDGAPVVLLYRGGQNATDPESWEREYRNALEVTKGHMIVDVAHGSEMAHDPNRNFTKSVLGQMVALEHVIQIADRGEMPAGIMLEASSAPSPTDPVMPHGLAVAGIRHLHALRNNVLTRTS